MEELALFNPKHDPNTPQDVDVSFVPMPAVSDALGAIVEPSTRKLGEIWKGYTHFSDGDVIFAKITPCMENGKSAVAKGLVNGIACGSTEFHVLRPLGGIPAEFFWRYLRQKNFRADAEQAMTGAVGQRRVPLDYLKKQEFWLPPLAEQRRILAKLDRLSARSTAARDHLTCIPKLAARAKQALLTAVFRGELTKDWRENNEPDKSAEALLDELRVLRRDQWIKTEEDKFRAKGKRPANTKWQARYKAPLPIGEGGEPYDVPETWCWAVAEEIVAPGAEVVYGIVQPGPQLDDGIPYVRGMDIVDGVIQTSQLLKTSPEIAEKYSRAALQGGDVLLGIIRATKVAIVPDELAGANITQGTARFRPSDAMTTKFLARWLEGPVAQGWLHSHYRGIDMPGLNLRDVRRCPIPLPPKNEQAEIVLRVDRALSRISQLTEEVQRAGDLVERLDEQLLAKAFRGDLVPQDPSDEPAEAVLARIREARAAAPKPKRGRQRKSEAAE